MDQIRKQVIALLAGTIARGLLWGAAAVSAKLGSQSLDESTANAVAYFLAGLIAAVSATVWSKSKDKTLLYKEPPKKET